MLHDNHRRYNCRLPHRSLHETDGVQRPQIEIFQLLHALLVGLLPLLLDQVYESVHLRLLLPAYHHVVLVRWTCISVS